MSDKILNLYASISFLGWTWDQLNSTAIWPIAAGLSGVVLGVAPHWHAALLAAGIIGLPASRHPKMENQSWITLITMGAYVASRIGSYASVIYVLGKSIE